MTPARPARAEPFLQQPFARCVDRVVREVARMVLGHANADGVAGGHDARQGIGQQVPVAAKGPAEVGGAEGDDVVDADIRERLRLARQVGRGVVKDLLIVVPEEGEARVGRVEGGRQRSFARLAHRGSGSRPGAGLVRSAPAGLLAGANESNRLVEAGQKSGHVLFEDDDRMAFEIGLAPALLALHHVEEDVARPVLFHVEEIGAIADRRSARKQLASLTHGVMVPRRRTTLTGAPGGPTVLRPRACRIKVNTQAFQA